MFFWFLVIVATIVVSVFAYYKVGKLLEAPVTAVLNAALYSNPEYKWYDKSLSDEDRAKLAVLEARRDKISERMENLGWALVIIAVFSPVFVEYQAVLERRLYVVNREGEIYAPKLAVFHAPFARKQIFRPGYSNSIRPNLQLLTRTTDRGGVREFEYGVLYYYPTDPRAYFDLFRAGKILDGHELKRVMWKNAYEFHLKHRAELERLLASADPQNPQKFLEQANSLLVRNFECPDGVGVKLNSYYNPEDIQ